MEETHEASAAATPARGTSRITIGELKAAIAAIPDAIEIRARPARDQFRPRLTADGPRRDRPLAAPPR